MTGRVIIGVSGKMGVGKSSFAYDTANDIRERMSVECRIISFADSLKEIVSNAYYFPLCYCYQHKDVSVLVSGKKIKQTHLQNQVTSDQLKWINEQIENELGDTCKVGKLLQVVGECFRAVSKCYFVDILQKIIMNNRDISYIIDDVRYPNEAFMIVSLNGLILRIVGEEPNENGGRDANHLSETALDDFTRWDFVIRKGDKMKIAWEKLTEFICKSC